MSKIRIMFIVAYAFILICIWFGYFYGPCLESLIMSIVASITTIIIAKITYETD